MPAKRTSGFAIEPPIEPMLAKLSEELPPEGSFLYEPKWDGFRAIVFRGGADVYIQSRDLKPLDRYFPELHDALLAALPAGCVIDGEGVIVTKSVVEFDLLAIDAESLMTQPAQERRARLEEVLAHAKAPLHLTPMTRERNVATEWLAEFEGAGLDGVIAKSPDLPYQPGKRSMLKIKHIRSADCVVAGFRWYKDRDDAVGSLLLGLYDDDGVLQHVGVASSFTGVMRRALLQELAPLREGAIASHPWREWSGAAAGDAQRMPGAQSRWSGGKDLRWEA